MATILRSPVYPAPQKKKQQPTDDIPVNRLLNLYIPPFALYDWPTSWSRKSLPYDDLLPSLSLRDALDPPPFFGTGVHIESELDTSNVDTYNFSRSISWLAGSPLILTIVNTKGSANANLPVPALTGITWSQANTQLYDGSSAKRVTVFYATPTSSGSATLVVTFGGVVQSNCFYSVEQYTGYDNTSPILQTKIGGVVSPAAAGPWSVTFDSALTTGSALQLSGAIDANVTMTPESGWTQLAQNGNTTPAHRSMVAISDTGTDTTPSMNASGSHTWAIVAIEIKPLDVVSFVPRTITPQLGPLLAQ